MLNVTLETHRGLRQLKVGGRRRMIEVDLPQWHIVLPSDDGEPMRIGYLSKDHGSLPRFIVRLDDDIARQICDELNNFVDWEIDGYAALGGHIARFEKPALKEADDDDSEEEVS